MSSVLKGVGTVINSLFGGSQQEKHGDSGAASHADHDEVEEVSGPATGSKRGRSNREVTSGRAAKRIQLSEDERRLLPHNTAAPKDAVSLSFPAEYNPDHDWNPPPQRQLEKSQMAKPVVHRHSGGIRPTNTLSKQTPQSGRDAVTRDCFATNDKLQHTQLPRSLQTQASRGANVAAPHEFRDDYLLASQPLSKKQRVAGATEQSNGTLVTDFDDDEPFPTAVGRKSTKAPSTSQVSGSQRSKEGARRTAISESIEQRNLDSKMKYREPVKKRRRQSNTASHPSSHESAKASQKAVSVKGQNRDKVGSKHEPVELDDDEPVQTNGPNLSSPAKQQQQQQQQRNAPPPIELYRGTDEYVERHQQRFERARVGEESSKINNEVESQRTKQPGQVRQSQKGVGPRKISISMKTSHDGSFQGYGQASEDSRRLADTFRRDHGHESRANNARPDRASPISDGEDPLNGARTVHSASSRNPSPHKQQYHPGRERPRPRVSRSDLASAITPPIFTEGGIPIEQVTGKSSSAANRSTEDVYRERIPIRSIYCQAVVLDEKNLDLKWDNTSDVYTLVSSQQVVRVPDSAGKQVPFKIGRREAGTWVQAKDCTGVQLKGSKSDISNGQILIEFDDERGLRECLDYLLHLNGRMQVDSTVTEDMMEKRFEKQRQAQTICHEKWKKNQLARLTSTTFFHKQPIAQRRYQRPESEEIQYEQDSEPEARSLRARERMKENTLSDELNQADFQQSRRAREQPETNSKYFDEPRRSTRQSKPVQTTKERTPSPERWTRIHKPKPWAHSVVYPSQGVRRVTVDFQDLERLDEGEFLNDNLVNFELRRIEETMAPEHRDKVHFFNTYFFSSLSQKNGKKEFNYDAVKRWTKNKDLFNVPYVVVPINVEFHWFVAIICNLPSIARVCSVFDNITEEMEIDEKPPISDEIYEVPRPAEEDHEVHVAQSSPNEGDADEVFTFAEDGRIASDVQMEGEEQAVASSRPSSAAGRKTKKKKKGPGLRKYDPKEPIIMSLDSFSLPRSAEIKLLKMYVEAEATSKRIFSAEKVELKGMSAKGIPEQPNFCDCGVYLVGYVAEFAKDPDTFVRKVLTREMDRNNDFAEFDASAKRAELRGTLLRLVEEQEVERRAQKLAKRNAAKGDQASRAPAQKEKPTNSAQAPASVAEDSGARKQTTPDSPRVLNSNIRTSSLPLSQRPANMLVNPSSDDENELQVEPPRAFGHSQDEEAPESDEMLVDEHSDDKAEPASEQEQVANGTFGTEADNLSPLSYLTTVANAVDPTRASKARTNNHTIVIEVDDSSATVEIPDSQENHHNHQHGQGQGKHTKFSD